MNVPEGGKLNYSDGIVAIDGSTGKGYGVVAIWTNKEYVDVSAVVADYQGNYHIESPRQLEDGDYTIYLYAFYKENESLVRTNYYELNIKIQDGVPYIVEKAKMKKSPVWKSAVDFAKVKINETKIEQLHSSAKNSSSIYLLSYGVFLIIALIGYFILWRKEN